MDPRSVHDLKQPHQSADDCKRPENSAQGEISDLQAEFLARAAEQLRRAREQAVVSAEMDRQAEIEETAAAAGERGEAGAT